MLWRNRGRIGAFDFADAKPDLLLCVDYRPNYRVALFQLPFTPVILWVRDPWGSVEKQVLASLRLPEMSDDQPNGVEPPDHTTYRQVHRLSWVTRRKVLFGVTAPFLRRRVADAYAIPEPELPVLPNPLDIEPGDIPKSERPSVLFLARLDPVKRPWVATRLAEDFPEVDFVFAGKAHFSGRGTWQPDTSARNVRFLGHIDGEDKRRAIASSWILLNTSIHEGLPVSMQEALACRCAILSTLDSEGIASRFGVFTGEFGGDGMEALPALRAGLRKLLDTPGLCGRLGEEGRTWVKSIHSPERFLEAFRNLCSRLGRQIP